MRPAPSQHPDSSAPMCESGIRTIWVLQPPKVMDSMTYCYTSYGFSTFFFFFGGGGGGVGATSFKTLATLKPSLPKPENS